MGFFKKSKKEDADIKGGEENREQTGQLGQDDVERMWQEAYRANPKAYEKDGNVIINFALTESTDSLFPIEPENEWSIEGVEISRWIITVVSLTDPQGGIIGQLEYHEAVRRLMPFVIARGGGWILIRGMSHEELDGLFDGIERKLI